ncbi:MAG: M42 family peptidase [Oscillospiraceae bacterium]|nr:M42 family peptidase [Oscillospiraceae bacterium]
MEINKKLLGGLLEELCKINGTSGAEERVREYIIGKIKDKENCTYSVNPLGCLIVEYRGRKRAENRLMISAHMDEVGMIITGINPDGTLNADCVGGVRADAVIGRQVVTEGGLIGAVGSKAVHHLSDEEKEKPPKFDNIHIDIGAENESAAKEKAAPGDMVYFTDGFVKNNGYIRSKAIDDRAGCAVMLAMILENVPVYDCVFTFVTQEEIGLRGARTAAFTVSPDHALVLEATTAADIPLSEGDKRCCILGEGPVVSYMDRSTIYDRGLYNLSRKTAEENGIPWQTKTVIAGGNDSGAIHISRGGVKTIALSVPCRYLHTPCCVIKEDDFYNTFALAAAMADKISGGDLS